MNIKTIALAGAIFASAVASAAFADTVETVGSYGPKTINKNTSSANLTTALFEVVADTDYIFSVFVDATQNGGEGKYLVASLLNSLDSVISSFTIQSNPSTSTDRNYESGPLSLTQGLYRIAFQYNTVGASNPVFVNTSAALTRTVQTVPVPGPEAGAGIGALAMAGVAYLAMRRRRSVAA